MSQAMRDQISEYVTLYPVKVALGTCSYHLHPLEDALALHLWLKDLWLYR